MEIGRTITKNTLALTLGQVGNKLISFLFNIYIARILGVAIYGEYNLINAFVALFSFLPDLGTNLIVIREIAQDKRSQRSLVGQAVVINTVFSLLAFILIAALFGPYSQGKISLLTVIFAAATLIVTSIRTVAILQFDGNEKMGFSAFFAVLNNVFSVTGALIGFNFTHSLTGLFAGVFLAAIASTSIVWIITSAFYPLPSLKFKVQKISKLLRYGLPLGLAAFAAQAYSRIDTLLLGRFLSKEIVGWYSAASVLVFASINLVNVPLMAAVYPTLSRLNLHQKRFRKTIVNIIIVILAWSIPAVVAVQFLASWVVPLLYGQGFSPAIPVLKTLIFIVPFISLSAFLYKLLIILGKQSSYLKISLSGALLNLLANITLIPRFGLLGAAYAAVFTHVALFAIYTLTVRKHLA